MATQNYVSRSFHGALVRSPHGVLTQRIPVWVCRGGTGSSLSPPPPPPYEQALQLWRLNTSDLFRVAWGINIGSTTAQDLSVNGARECVIGVSNVGGFHGPPASLYRIDSSGQVRWTATPAREVLAVHLSDAGDVLAGTVDEGGDTLWRYGADGSLLWSVDLGDLVGAVVRSPDGAHAYALMHRASTNRVAKVRVSDGVELATWSPAIGLAGAIAIDAAGELIVGTGNSSSDPAFYRLDPDLGEVSVAIGGTRTVRSVAVDAQSRVYLCGTNGLTGTGNGCVWAYEADGSARRWANGAVHPGIANVVSVCRQQTLWVGTGSREENGFHSVFRLDLETGDELLAMTAVEGKGVRAVHRIFALP